MYANFDPARETAVLALALKAIEQVDGSGAGDIAKLVAWGDSIAAQPAREVDSSELLRLAGAALCTPSGPPTDVALEQRIAARTTERASARKPLPDRSQRVSWQVIETLGDSGSASAAPFIRAGLELCEAITVAWPPPGAAATWHPARVGTCDDVRDLASAALARGPRGTPIESVEGLDWLELEDRETPGDHLRLALAAWHDAETEGIERAVGEVVRQCAAISLEVAGAGAGDPLQEAIDQAATVIDGAGFAGGAAADIEYLLGSLLIDLAMISGTVERYASDPGRYRGTLDVAAWPQQATQTALVILWLAARAKGYAPH